MANSLAAVQAGATHVQGTINGYGERCGNANLVTIWANLALKLGCQTVPGRRRPGPSAELAHFVAEVANIAPDAHAPYVGTSAFAHKGGVHGAATVRVEQAYQHVDPALVGGTSRLVVSELGGKANAAWRLRQLGPLAGRGRRSQPRCRASSSSSRPKAPASREPMRPSRCSSAPPRAGYVAPFRIVDFTVIVERRNGGASRAEASVKVEVDGEVLHTAADGNGPVNALDLALRKALGAFYPALDDGAPRRLQGPDHRRGCGDRRADASDHRDRPRVGHVDHRWRRREHHRRLAGRASRLARVRDLAARCPPRAPRRARLVHGRALRPAPAPGGKHDGRRADRRAGGGTRRRPSGDRRLGLLRGRAWSRSDEAQVGIATHAFNYGTSVFEGIRAYRQDSGGLGLLFGPEHYERLLRNARLLRASVPESAERPASRSRSSCCAATSTRATSTFGPIIYKARALDPSAALGPRATGSASSPWPSATTCRPAASASRYRAGSASATTPSRPAARSPART